jgi:hypothetical protein
MSAPSIDLYLFKPGRHLAKTRIKVEERLGQSKREEEAFVLNSPPIPVHSTGLFRRPKRSVCYVAVEGMADVLPLHADPEGECFFGPPDPRDIRENRLPVIRATKQEAYNYQNINIFNLIMYGSIGLLVLLDVGFLIMLAAKMGVI